MKRLKRYLISRGGFETRPYRLLPALALGLLLYSCAPVRPAIPVYPGGVRSFLAASQEHYDTVRGAFNFRFKGANGHKISAEAVAIVRPGSLTVRIYHVGMLVGNLKSLAEKRGLELDYEVYRRALRKALLWWALDEYTAQNLPGGKNKKILIRSGNLSLLLASRTYVPVGETIEMPGGKSLVVAYSDLRPVSGFFWYPFRITMRYCGQRLDLKAEHIELSHSQAAS